MTQSELEGQRCHTITPRTSATTDFQVSKVIDRIMVATLSVLTGRLAPTPALSGVWEHSRNHQFFCLSSEELILAERGQRHMLSGRFWET
jgi:hypothetical protein